VKSTFQDPTVAEAEKLSAAFDYFNKALFNSALESCRVTIASKGNAQWRGCFSPSSCVLADGSVIHQIILDTAYTAECLEKRDLRQLFSTLVHEMAHQATAHEKAKHGKEWRELMASIDLPPKKSGSTWYSASHDIEDNGFYDTVFSRIPSEILNDWLSFKIAQKKEKKSNRRSCECPVCGTKVSISKQDITLYCGTDHEITEMVISEDE
jgi:SprT-like family